MEAHRISPLDENGAKKLVYDEALLFKEMRAMMAPEAMCHLLRLPITKLSHTVISLGIHEENREMVYFGPNAEEKKKRIEEGDEKTKFQAWSVFLFL